MLRSRQAALAAIALSCAALTACGGSSATGTAGVASVPTPSASAALTGKITVFAAASLTGSFTKLGQAFQAAHPGTSVTFSFGPSSGLATSIVAGAPADVFASASAKNMDQVVTAKLASSPVIFAKNVMEIAVPPANPGKITKLADLAKPGEKVVLCAAAVPCGVTARKVFSNAKITVTPVSNEVDVKSTLAKVQLGEADAGVVYVTDVLAAGSKVKGIPIPADLNASTSYPIAALSGSTNATLAKAFTDFVLSGAGVSELAAAGFEKP